ncbi:ferredoxin 1b [Electrophorus electricus]|uniref:ferredoxin 1b n=1 Tax=Electrophorus electricus TaxID=8005 RepID=UPI0015D00D5F|nr:ferredoxin 1b [Electrophorus electricus]
MAVRACAGLLRSSSGFCSLNQTFRFQLNIRTFSTQPVCHSRSSSQSKVLLHFVNQNGMKTSVTGTEGESLLDVVVKKNVQIDGFGACEGTLSCSTCHLIFEDSMYDRMETMADDEMDMLDLAYGLTKTSRLGCQVTLQPWMDGMTVRVPQEVKDQRDVQETKSKQ